MTRRILKYGVGFGSWACCFLCCVCMNRVPLAQLCVPAEGLHEPRLPQSCGSGLLWTLWKCSPVATHPFPELLAPRWVLPRARLGSSGAWRKAASQPQGWGRLPVRETSTSRALTAGLQAKLLPNAQQKRSGRWSREMCLAVILCEGVRDGWTMLPRPHQRWVAWPAGGSQWCPDPRGWSGLWSPLTPSSADPKA